MTSELSVASEPMTFASSEDGIKANFNCGHILMLASCNVATFNAKTGSSDVIDFSAEEIMKSFSTVGFKAIPPTVKNLISGKLKPIYSIRTMNAEYSGNTLDSTLCLWKEHSEDESPVVAIHQCG